MGLWIFVFLILNFPLVLCHLSQTRCLWRLNDIKEDHVENCIFFFTLTPNNQIYYDELLDALFSAKEYQLLLAFIFALEEVNSNPNLLPNTSLEIFTSSSYCDMEAMYREMTLELSSATFHINYNCPGRKFTVALSGSMWTASARIGTLLQLYQIPQLNYGPFHAYLSDRDQFPYLYQVAPKDTYLALAMVSLMLYFKWIWVGLVTSDDEQGIQFISDMREHTWKNGICLAYTTVIPLTMESYLKRTDIIFDQVAISSAKVVIIYGDTNPTLSLSFQFWDYLGIRRIWVTTSQLDVIINKRDFTPDSLHGMFTFSHYQGEIYGLKSYIQDIKSTRFPDDISLGRLGWLRFHCSVSNCYYNTQSNCSTEMSLEWLSNNTFDLAMSEASYYIYSAVYAVAYSLHMMLFQQFDQLGDSKTQQEISISKLSHILKNIHLTDTLGDPVSLNLNGDLDAEYEIFNIWKFPQDLGLKVKIGQFSPYFAQHQQLYLSEEIIKSSTGSRQIPSSVCSVSCSPGFRKSPQAGMASCCFDCFPCPESEITNATDMAQCVKCPDDRYANLKQTHCLQRAVTFLSFAEPLGMALASIALFFSALTALVLGVFVKHQDTPIVKANNRTLSYILLISLLCCFLCPLLYIGHPNRVMCILQQTTFGALFTVAVSTVLTKTITVVLAFQLKTPGRKMRHILISRRPKFIIPFCVTIQLFLYGIWLGTFPPFTDTDTHSEHGQIIIVCNKGSVTAFYCVLGYLGFLALVSFTVAFFARNLPDTFNEAKFLTFSMLVFCSVWVTFLPVYHSTKGKVMVAVEVFSILASSAGLLGCIFLPKCHIILLRPDKNYFPKFREKA